MLLLAGCISVSMGTLAWSDSDAVSENSGKATAEQGDAASNWTRSTTVAAVASQQYKTECSACHFAYQPGFLPERSWVKIMGSLEDHFGDNAKLDEASRSSIEGYLRARAADVRPYRYSSSFMRSIKTGDTPIRISGTAYFERKHDELSARMVRDNPKVRSFANCAACHVGADKGSFDEYEVEVPGFGRWED